jgi:outer membrane protein assembly factor BamB
LLSFFFNASSKNVIPLIFFSLLAPSKTSTAMKHQLFSLIFTMILFGFGNTLMSQEVLEWRGADRTGYYHETGLLDSWPEEGPPLVWEYAGLGNGYSSPAITKDRVYITGEHEKTTWLYALDHEGNLIWKKEVGPEWTINYPGSRTTPTIVDDLLYVSTGLGALVCMNATSGDVVWSLNIADDLKAPNTRFGFAESLLVHGDKVYCTVGNPDTNVVAFNRFTGSIDWISPGVGEMTSFCSPKLISLPDRDILVTFSKLTLMGFDAQTGELLWTHKQEGQGDVQVNTPWYEDGAIYYIASDGNGAVKLKLSEDGSTITEEWRNKRSDNLMGAFIKLGDYIYTSSYNTRQYYIQDATTGELTDSVKFDKGSIIYADGKLYLYNQRGKLGLFEPAGPSMKEISTFRITKGSKAHFAHPVICDGILYVRHGDALLAYDIREKQ